MKVDEEYMNLVKKRFISGPDRQEWGRTVKAFLCPVLTDSIKRGLYLSAEETREALRYSGAELEETVYFSKGEDPSDKDTFIYGYVVVAKKKKDSEVLHER